jgi:hypothetical protein
MKKKATFLLLLAALALVGPLSAQRPGPGMGLGPGRGGQRLERLIGLALERRDSLALSADQVEGLEALRSEIEQSDAALRAQMEQARADTTVERSELRERMRTMMEQARAERSAQSERFEQLLTQEQRERLRPLLRGPRSGRPDGFRRGPRGPGGPGPAAIGARGRGPGFGAPGPVAQAYREGVRDGLHPRVGGRRTGSGPGSLG